MNEHDRIGRDDGTGNGPRVHAPELRHAVAMNRQLAGLPPQNAETEYDGPPGVPHYPDPTEPDDGPAPANRPASAAVGMTLERAREIVERTAGYADLLPREVEALRMLWAATQRDEAARGGQASVETVMAATRLAREVRRPDGTPWEPYPTPEAVVAALARAGLLRVAEAAA